MRGLKLKYLGVKFGLTLQRLHYVKSLLRLLCLWIGMHLLIISTPPQAQDRDEFSARFALVTSKVSRIEKDIATLKSEYGALVTERKQLEASLLKNRDDEKRLSLSAKDYARRRGELAKELEEAQRELGKREAKIKARMRALYISTTYFSFGDFLFQTRGDQVERVAVYAKALKRHDDTLFKDLREGAAKVTTATQGLDAAASVEREALVALEAKRTELEAAVRRTKAVGEEVTSKKKAAEKSLARLREEAEHLESLLEQLTKTEQALLPVDSASSQAADDGNRETDPPGPDVTQAEQVRPTAVPLASSTDTLAEQSAGNEQERDEKLRTGEPPSGPAIQLKGLIVKGSTLTTPVKFRILQPFGKGKGTSFSELVSSKGVDGEAEVGARVEALAAGRVAFVGPMPSFGTVVIIDHGQRHYSLYGRLGQSLVSKGMLIPARRALGTTGELSEKGRNFYLEVRRDGVALDPVRVVRGLS
jgi:septal ring factor EnvC (AmiA/AmiB activator)